MCRRRTTRGWKLFGKGCTVQQLSGICAVQAPVAHSDRALGFEPRGSRFESCRARFFDLLRRDKFFDKRSYHASSHMRRRPVKDRVASWELMKRWEQKALAQALRCKGFSYREILQQLPFRLSRSTVSQWCRHIELTPDQLYRTSSYRNRLLGSKTTQEPRAKEIEVLCPMPASKQINGVLTPFGLPD